LSKTELKFENLKNCQRFGALSSQDEESIDESSFDSKLRFVSGLPKIGSGRVTLSTLKSPEYK